VIVVQQADESASTFARRFIRKVTSAVTGGMTMASALLVIAPAFDAARLEARCTIARTLIRSFDADLEHELVLMSTSDAASECRPHLLALAEILREGAKASWSIRVRCDLLPPEKLPFPRLTSQPPQTNVRVAVAIAV
jgi:hypothetical protein